ncbi:MAG: class I SAM-dependent methyltransferase [Desulfomonile tiedjei]|uniref:Class I SAM-dependent methyltransferase n=1 Tax=Desulfomonile tiedjei TaxID=2358 RepID=A0A9D6V0K7_9BACT|nr:class I SAM-dependent methyltransferase [Desulfomonile tiedjei]
MKWRTECYKRFGAVLDLPLRSPGEVIPELANPKSIVLDVGAGAHKPFRSTIERLGAAYFSMDTDPEGTFDFMSFSDVPQDTIFDLVLANQVLEHVSVDDAFNMVSQACQRMAPGGRILVTVPNAAHPVRQRDCTHITPWPANDLYSLLRSAGFEVDSMARYNKFPLTEHPLKRWIVDVVCHEFRMDWCDSIMAIGTRR